MTTTLPQPLPNMAHNQPSLLLRRRKRNRRLVILATVLTATVAEQYYHLNFYRQQQHDSKLRGVQQIEELLSGHLKRIRDNIGVTKEGFLYVEDLLIRKSSLRPTRYIGTAEQLGIFLYTVTTDLLIRKLVERFQRSTETIDRTYYKVMKYFFSENIYKSAI